MNTPIAMNGRRALFLQELGIGPVWVRRVGAGSAGTTATRTAEPVPVVAVIPAAVALQVAEPVATVAVIVPAWDSSPPVDVTLATPTAPNAPNAAQVKSASAWDDAPVPAPVRVAPVPEPVTALLPDVVASTATTPPALSDDGIADMNWSELKAAVATCTRCHLCQTRTKTVFGIGDEKARWLFVGEGPGRNEDKQGEPFVGPAGKLLDNMLLAMELKRGENTFIANAVKCRPIDSDGKDRPPTPDESAACRPYLERQIALLKPVTIVALGKVAALALLGGDPKTSVAALRERVHHYGNVPVVATYHPAYLLRKPVDKAKSWRDLCLAAEAYANVGNLAV